MSKPSLVVTAGEPSGIGPDVVLEALRLSFDARIAVIADIHVLRARAATLGIECRLKPVIADNALASHEPGLINVIHTPCATSVTPGQLNIANAKHVMAMLELAARLTEDGLFDAMVTAPVQKSIINDAGIAFSGHTEFFADYFGCSEVVMLLANDRFKVALATTHLPLRKVADAITFDSLSRQIAVIHDGFKRLYGIARPSIAMLGLNPHAGEGGHLGREEIDVLIPAVEAARSKGFDVSLPLPADTAFVSNVVEDADVVLAMFHDQGLPVLKTSGFGSSVNISLGLPVIRTSVDHGTALTLAGSGEASANSLVSAIREAQICALQGRSSEQFE